VLLERLIVHLHLNVLSACCLLRAVSELFKALRIHEFQPELNPNMSGKEKVRVGA
jgi:hypothetical protein